MGSQRGLRARVTTSELSVRLDVVPPPRQWGIIAEEERMRYTHINFEVAKMLLSEAAHGLLGVTSRLKYDSRGAAIMSASGSDGAGIIDGTVADYEVSSLMACDFKYSACQF